MSKLTKRSFGAVVRERRRQLDLTQEQVGDRIGTSTPYVGHLESGKRHPSENVVARLSQVLGLNRRELFFLANPKARALLDEASPTDGRSAWDDFRRDRRIQRAHNITSDEMDLLARAAAMGEVRAARDFIYILNAVRQALGR